MKNARLITLAAFALMSVAPDLANAAAPVAAPAEPTWLSPTALAASPDGKVLYVACATAGRVAVFDLNAREIRREIAVPGSPLGLALTPDGRTLYVTCAAAESTVCVIDTATAAVTARISGGHTVMAPVLSPDGRTLYVCNRFNNTVAFIDLATRKTIRTVPVPREPIAAAITHDGKFLIVANHLPAGRASVDVVAASLSVIEVARGQVTKEIALPNGSGLLREVRISPDGRHAIVAHQISRFHLPTTQIERGWINTNAVTLIDIPALRRINTVLLDNLDAGAATPWAAAWSPDGRSFFITHAGTHELSVVDFPALLAKLDCRENPAAEASDDLSFITGTRRRIKSPVSDRGPRAVVLVGTKAYLANYFSDTLTAIELAAPVPAAISIPLHAPAEMSVMRRGEFLFNDASICFQGWQSCASCHSSDARVDGFNWDNLNDGIGNPKNSKSLLLAHQTPPSMWLGVRANHAVAVRAGIRNSLFTVQPESVAVAIGEYLTSLTPAPSPYLVHGKLSAAAQRGETLFRSEKVGCSSCHPAPLFTDLKFHDVGTRGRLDQIKDEFDTPTLLELWRTAPYLHDGSGNSIRELLTTRNHGNRHGTTSHLKPQEIDDLAEYVLSL